MAAGLKEYMVSGDASKFPKQSLVQVSQGAVIDLTADEGEEPEEKHVWQVSCGDDGWMNFLDSANDVVERAFRRRSVESRRGGKRERGREGERKKA